MAEWLQASRGLENDASLSKRTGAAIAKRADTDSCFLPLSTVAAKTAFPPEQHGSGTVTILIALPSGYSLQARHDGSLAIVYGSRESAMHITKLLIEVDKNEEHVGALDELRVEADSPRFEEQTP